MVRKGAFRNTPDDSEVLVIMLGSGSESESVLHRHGEFLFRIKQGVGLTVVRSADDAIRFINTQHPSFILAIDSEFANPANRRLQTEVAFIVEHGAAFIMCGEFPRNVDVENFRNMAINAFNLGWEPGPIYKGNFQLHKACDVLDRIHRSDGIELDLEILAALVGNVDDRSRLYISRDFDQSNGKTFASVAFEKRAQGYYGWVGDLKGLGSIHNVIFKFIDSAGQKLKTGRLRNLRRGRNMPQNRGGRPGAQYYNNRNKRARAQARPRGPCDNCGKDFTSQICFECQLVFYCSMSCKAAASRKHREVCAAHRVTIGRAIEMAKVGNPMPLVRELIVTPKDHQEVLERLIDCYRFRVESLYRISGIKAGCYRVSSTGNVHLEEFVTFLRHIQRSNQPARPPWWDLASQTQCEDMARNHIMRYFIGRPINEEEVIEYYGTRIMPEALRTLSDVLYGGPVPDREEVLAEQEKQATTTHSALNPGGPGDEWERASSGGGTEEIGEALGNLRLERRVYPVAVVETMPSSSAATSTSSRYSVPSRPRPAPVTPAQKKFPKKREPIVHRWQPSDGNSP
ncbi:hypothetical protein TWF481_008298 [Arthrobotrys musiformis]|uniref:MYND-type domain-containing protein n=1 Tax=Arthrobotrys musiformis TaxID=47236 RepID=A0AAV9W6Q5_9PEZI